MKYIFIALIIIIGGIIWSNTSPKAEAPAVVPTETSSVPKEEKSPTAEEHGMTPEEHAAMMGESTAGTDAGMEMPEMDMSGMDHSTMNMADDTTKKVFDIAGVNFKFDVTEIKVKEGDTVTINFKSTDGYHDVVINEFNARTAKIKTGGLSSVTFVANKKGTFEYYCSVGQHRMSGMVGKLVVE